MHIYTRSADEQLYGMMKSCFNSDNEFHQCKQFPSTWGAIVYLHHIILETNDDWIVSCDEDCFITNENSIHELIEFMKANNYDYCGMPDGGICKHRNCSWTNINPFFIILNAQKIREHLAKDLLAINMDQIRYNESKLKDHLILGKIRHNEVDHNNMEPFSGFLYWLAYNFRGIYLDAQEHADGLSTILLGIDGNPFAKHSWFSREFTGAHHDRILNLYNESKCHSQIKN